MTLTVKTILQGFVAHLGAAITTGERDLASPFEMPVPPQLVAQVEAAMDLAQSSAQQVILLTAHMPARALIGGLVLREAGLTIEGILANFSETTVDPLVTCLRGLKESRLLLVEAPSIPLSKSEGSDVRYLLLSPR